MTVATRLRVVLPTQHKQGVLSGFIRRIGVTDLVVIIWAVVGAQMIRFGPNAVTATFPTAAVTPVDLSYTMFTVALGCAWMLMLRAHGAYDHRLLGHGSEEYKIVATASLRLFAVMAVASYAIRLDVARGYVVIALS